MCLLEKTNKSYYWERHGNEKSDSGKHTNKQRRHHKDLSFTPVVNFQCKTIWNRKSEDKRGIQLECKVKGDLGTSTGT